MAHQVESITRPPKGGKNGDKSRPAGTRLVTISYGVSWQLARLEFVTISERFRAFVAVLFLSLRPVASPGAVVDFHIHAGLHISAYYRLVMHY